MRIWRQFLTILPLIGIVSPLNSCMTFQILEWLFAIGLIACILVQQKGSGLGSAFGGSGAVYSTKRGIEKSIFYATIVFAVLFFGTTTLHLLVA